MFETRVIAERRVVDCNFPGQIRGEGARRAAYQGSNESDCEDIQRVAPQEGGALVKLSHEKALEYARIERTTSYRCESMENMQVVQAERKKKIPPVARSHRGYWEWKI